MIQTVSLFPILNQKLVELLKTLNPEDWNKKTIAKHWTVKDIASHLLDTTFRALSRRDKHILSPDRNISTYPDLVNYLNELNAVWVKATKRISSRVLTELLETTGTQYCEYLATLDPNAPAAFSVAWTGEDISTNWFDTAREYTEKWHHQQQIREAVGQPGIMTRELFYPVMDTFMCGLPFTYRNTPAGNNTVIQVTINSSIGGDWFIIRKENRWQRSNEFHSNPDAGIRIPPDVAWKLFTKGITPATALNDITITGHEEMAKVALTLVAVMA